MSKPKVAILGSTGMLGYLTLQSFAQSDDFEIIATYRNDKEVAKLKKKYPNVQFRKLDAFGAGVSEIYSSIKGSDWVVNAIGIIKPYIHDDDPVETEIAIRVNSLFPHLLSKAAKKANAVVLQIATDCVYSGEKGKYIESDPHDALDVYGKTKSLGEAFQDNMHHLRCSIIGPEIKAHLSLMDWFLGQSKKAEVNGFTNHSWNGVTTLHYARVCQGIIKSKIALPHIHHVIPGNSITKANLLKSFAKNFKREDITISSIKAPKVIDRTLATTDEKLNKRIWQAAGYKQPPTIEQMVSELAEFSS